MASDTADRLRAEVLLAIREHGYAGTSMQDLLRAAGASSSSMYHHFPGGKEDLVASAVRAEGLGAADRIADVFAGRSPADAITLIFDAAAAEMVSHDFQLGCPIGVPATEAPVESALIRDAVAEVFSAWSAAYAQGLRGVGLEAADADRLGRTAVALYEGAVMLARATRSTEPYADAARILLAQLPP